MTDKYANRPTHMYFSPLAVAKKIGKMHTTANAIIGYSEKKTRIYLVIKPDTIYSTVLFFICIIFVACYHWLW